MRSTLNIFLLYIYALLLLCIKSTGSLASQNTDINLFYGQPVTRTVETSVGRDLDFSHKIEITYTLIRGEKKRPDQILLNLERSELYQDIGESRGMPYLFIFDEMMDPSDLEDMGLNLARNFKPEHIRNFFHVIGNQDVLTLADPFQTGYAAFSKSPQRQGTGDFIYFNLDPDIADKTIGIEIRMYYGSTSRRITDSFDPIYHRLRMPDDMFYDPDIDCEAYLHEQTERINRIITDIKDQDISGRIENAIKSNQINRLKSTLNDVERYQESIRQLQEVKTGLLKLDVPKPCTDFKEQVLTDLRPFTEKKPILEKNKHRLVTQIELLERCTQLVKTHRQNLERKERVILRKTEKAKSLEVEYRDLLELLSELSDKEKESYNTVLNQELIEASGSIDRLLQMQDNLVEMRQDLISLDEPACEEQISVRKQQTGHIRDQVQSLVTRYEDFQKFINEGLAITDPERVKKIQELKSIYEPGFSEIHNKLQDIETTLYQLREEFNSKRAEDSFTRRTRNTMKGELEELDKDFRNLKEHFESLLDELIATVDDRLENDTYRSAGIANTHIDKNNETLNLLSDKIIRLRQDLNRSPLDEPAYLMIISVAVLLAIIIFGAWVYFRAMKKKRLKNKKNKAKVTNHENISELEAQYSKQHKSAKVGGITIKPKYSDKNIQELANKGRGIDHARASEGKDYFMMDIGNVWEDTVVRKVYINQRAIVKTYKFFYESCVAEGKVLETGGYLIGFWDYNADHPGCYDVALEDFIEPGDDAIRGEYQLNFGAKIGVRLDQTIKNHREKTGREMLLLAWFHSHPGMKIFLSNHDLALQNQLTSEVHRQKLLAMVIDPNTHENDKMVFNTGIFSYRSDGLMNNNEGGMKLISWKTLYSWAMAPKVPRLDQYFLVNLETFFAKTCIHRLYFNDKSIIRFSLFLDETLKQPGTTGYFAGKIILDHYRSKRMAIINDFFADPANHTSDDDTQLIGCFVSGDSPKDDNWQKNDSQYRDKHFVIFCNNKEDGLLILTRQTPAIFNAADDAKSRLNTGKLESWPTRRR